MAKLPWYWHRLRAMTPVEMALHARKKLRQLVDARRPCDEGHAALEARGKFPALPPPDSAPAVVRESLQRDMEDILAGRWKAFGHLELKVDDPPKWHRDYLVGRNFDTTASAFKLNHRELPGGADIKLIWELSRWHPLVRLALAAWVLRDERAAGKCVAWLEDWVKHNPPCRGWNWTSALEVGMRMVQFTWIDALLTTPQPGKGPVGAALEPRLAALRRNILPAHALFAWRHKSFGSSANNHLLGECTGLIVATTRWPALEGPGAPLTQLQALWEREVLAQFAEDGGNREQALNYHLFSWEFCWQARQALRASGRAISGKVEDRLRAAAGFFREVQAQPEHWDYGDSDGGFVTPLFADATTCALEWREWMDHSPRSQALAYWVGEPPVLEAPRANGAPARTQTVNEWWLYPDSGIGLCKSGPWWLRWDVSPLGYRRTAAHGHLDALHLSIWHKGVAMVIDPGTGAYYADADLRNRLASWAAHNGPCLPGLDVPRRLGPFLWAESHEQPGVTDCGGWTQARLRLGAWEVCRRVRPTEGGVGWRVEDSCQGTGTGRQTVAVRWQFAPGSRIERLSGRHFVVHRENVGMVVEVSQEWEVVEVVDAVDTPGQEWEEGVVSPAFRAVSRAPCLRLLAPARSTGLHTVFSCWQRG